MARRIEWILATVGAAVTVWVAYLFSQAPKADSSLASIVLIVVALLGVTGLVAVARDAEAGSRRWGAVIWLVAGALTALVVAGGFSIGLFLIPASLAFVAAALIAGRRRQRSLPSHVCLYLASVVASGLMLTLAHMLWEI